MASRCGGRILGRLTRPSSGPLSAVLGGAVLHRRQPHRAEHPAAQQPVGRSARGQHARGLAGGRGRQPEPRAGLGPRPPAAGFLRAAAGLPAAGPVRPAGGGGPGDPTRTREWPRGTIEMRAPRRHDVARAGHAARVGTAGGGHRRRGHALGHVRLPRTWRRTEPATRRRPARAPTARGPPCGCPFEWRPGSARASSAIEDGATASRAREATAHGEAQGPDAGAPGRE